MFRTMTLRPIWIAIGTLAMLLGVGLQQGETREPRPYCMQGGRGTTGGMLDCSYYTMEQCLRTLVGGEGICSVNPALGWRARELPPYQPPPRRSRDVR